MISTTHPATYAGKILCSGIPVIFDIDGCLAPYEFGEHNHRIDVPDDKWEDYLENHNPYLKLSKSQNLYFMIHKIIGIDKCYVCSKSSGIREENIKRDFCVSQYKIMSDNIIFVKSKRDKLSVAEVVLKKTGSPNIAVVDDSLDVLDTLMKNPKIRTIHISSFTCGDLLEESKFSDNECKLLVECLCNEQNQLLKAHEYESARWKFIEGLKIKLKS